MDTYEKKYKEAQGWIEKIYPTLQHEQQMEAEAFFPELKESEDERIRKALIKGLSSCGRKYWGGFEIKAAIAWLEKQEGKHKTEPQSRWRPSEEQMYALAWALSLAKNCGEECAFDLRTLQEQLKNL